jgi:hypothetical protein
MLNEVDWALSVTWCPAAAPHGGEINIQTWKLLCLVYQFSIKGKSILFFL